MANNKRLDAIFGTIGLIMLLIAVIGMVLLGLHFIHY